jgi:Cell wall-active antibiotics response 4TMS YvqF
MSAVTQPLEPPAPPPPPEPAARSHGGRIVGGILLIVLGVGWLSDLLGVEFPWDVVLPAALVAIGLALLVVAGRGGSHSALVTAGIVVTVLVLLGSLVDVPFGSGIGERAVAPTSIATVEDEYRLAIGDLTVDLGGVEDFASSSTLREIEVRVGIGHATLILPSSASVRVVARAGLGNVRLFEQEGSGFDVERTTVDGGDLDAVITVSVGLGQVEVDRG